MTFESALKRLAEKEPGKFKIGYPADFEVMEFEWGHGWLRLYKFTQDDIDKILSLIGWNYEVRKSTQKWYYIIYGEDDFLKFECEEDYPTKLEAAKAALIAVVEKQYS